MTNVITFDPLHWPNVITFAGFRITWLRQWLLLRWCSNEWFQPIRISDTYIYRAKCNGNVISVSGSKFFTSLHLPHYISNVITFATILVGSPPGIRFCRCHNRCPVGYYEIKQTTSRILVMFQSYVYFQHFGWPTFAWCDHDLENVYGIAGLFLHDDVIKWKHFPRYWPFVREIKQSTVNSPHTVQWRGALVFPFISAWINGWVNNGEAGDLRRHRANYDVIVMRRTTDLWC